MRIQDIIKLLFCIGSCLGAGFLGSLFMTNSLDTWYASIKKPPFNPPDWIFAPVWTALYIMMGISAFLVWQRGLKTAEVRYALMVFMAQLILNLLWTPAFFGAHSPLLGLMVIIPLWCAILYTIILFYGISKVSAVILIPYLAWVSFAVLLNAALFYLNRI